MGELSSTFDKYTNRSKFKCSECNTLVQRRRHLIILSIQTRGNWFQTNPLEHESDDSVDNTISSVCVTNGKDMALQRQN